MPDQSARSSGLRPDPVSDDVSWALLCAHPGHELRAYHFLERTRAPVFVLTDGGGSSGASRAGHSRALLAAIGAECVEPFGRLADREAYAALMRRDPSPFASVVAAVADRLVGDGITALAVDAAEGYNPVHDVCHWIGVAAVARAARDGAAVALYELDLVGPPDGAGAGLRLTLDAAALDRKIAAATAYGPLRSETEAALARFGREAFRMEFLRRTLDVVLPADSWIPDYEQVGAARVRDGRYTSVVRYATHVRPVVEALLTTADAHDYAASLGPAH